MIFNQVNVQERIVYFSYTFHVNIELNVTYLTMFTVIQNKSPI